MTTPEQEARAAAERDPSPWYDIGWPKYHRHFGDYEIHLDVRCDDTNVARRRVYVFDDDVLDAHEAHIRADERAKAYDDVIAVTNARRRMKSRRRR